MISGQHQSMTLDNVSDVVNIRIYAYLEKFMFIVCILCIYSSNIECYSTEIDIGFKLKICNVSN
jgi:hypothetical protein